jgi:hypothetical protein
MNDRSNHNANGSAKVVYAITNPARLLANPSREMIKYNGNNSSTAGSR